MDAYDAWARLTSASNAQWTVTEKYDRFGNRMSQSAPVLNNVTPSYTTNRLLDAGYGYDLNGNMTSDGANTLIYDGENRLASSTNGSASGAYTYDGNNLRIQKASGSTTTVYIFSGSKVIEEYDKGAAVTSPSREYIYSGGSLLATISGSSTTYHHPDHLSERVATDQNGNVARTFGHFPFGETWYETGTASKWKFTSYERDNESGNDYAMMRYDIYRLARFASPDPIGGNLADPQTLNRYTYTRNDPVDLVDPSGLYMCEETEYGYFCHVSGFGTYMVFYPEPADPSGGGGGGGKIGTARAAVLAILSGDSICALFFNRYARHYQIDNDSIESSSTPAADMFSSDSINLVQGTLANGGQGITKNADGTQTQPWGAQTTQGTGWDSAIQVNTPGAFFESVAFINGTTSAGSLTMGGTANPRQYGGDSPQARILILLHEFAHNIGAIPSDSGSSGQSTINTQTILDHCKDAIDKAAKQ